MNFVVLKEDDNIELLLSMLALSEEKPPENAHHILDDELKNVIEEAVDQKLYVEQMYQAMLAMYNENYELHKKIDNLVACNELLKSHIAQEKDDNESFFTDPSDNQFTN